MNVRLSFPFNRPGDIREHPALGGGALRRDHRGELLARRSVGNTAGPTVERPASSVANHDHLLGAGVRDSGFGGDFWVAGGADEAEARAFGGES